MQNALEATITISTWAQIVKRAAMGITDQMAFAGTLCTLTRASQREAGNSPSRAMDHTMRVRVVRPAINPANTARETRQNAATTTYLGK